MLFTHKFESLFVDRTKVKVERGRVVCAGADGRYNVPQKNLQVLVMGRGTSITHEAVEKLSIEGVQIVWAGAGGAPYICAGVTQYHPTQLQRDWIESWGGEKGRLGLAIEIFKDRLDFTRRHAGDVPCNSVEEIKRWANKAESCQGVQELLGVEGDRTRRIYADYTRRHGLSGFTREHSQTDPNTPDIEGRVNAYLSHGNALAYGIAAGAMWHLGLSPAYPLAHGLTRNGGLIFDAADLVKDGVVIGWAFECYELPLTQAMYELRHRLKHTKADKFIIDTLADLPYRSSSK